MTKFSFMEYEVSKLVRKEQLEGLRHFRLHQISINENGEADRQTYLAIADYLEELPLHDANEFSVVDFVISIISVSQEMRVFANLYWLEKYGKPHPIWGKDFLLEIPESDEDRA